MRGHKSFLIAVSEDGGEKRNGTFVAAQLCSSDSHNPDVVRVKSDMFDEYMRPGSMRLQCYLNPGNNTTGCECTHLYTLLDNFGNIDMYDSESYSSFQLSFPLDPRVVALLPPCGLSQSQGKWQ